MIIIQWIETAWLYTSLHIMYSPITNVARTSQKLNRHACMHLHKFLTHIIIFAAYRVPAVNQLLPVFACFKDRYRVLRGCMLFLIIRFRSPSAVPFSKCIYYLHYCVCMAICTLHTCMVPLRTPDTDINIYTTLSLKYPFWLGLYLNQVHAYFFQKAMFFCNFTCINSNYIHMQGLHLQWSQLM